MTVTEAVTYCRNLHNAQGDTNWSDAEIYTLLQAKEMEACAVIGLIEAGPTSIPTVAGTQSYAYPSGMVRVRRVRYNGFGLKYLDFRRFEARTPVGVAPSGTPREYTLWNNVIYLVPTPAVTNDTISVFGESQPSAITSTSSTLDIPVVFHTALCEAVIGEMFMKDLNPTFASKYEERWYKVHLPAMERFAKQRRRTGSPITVTDADSSLETEFGII